MDNRNKFIKYVKRECEAYNVRLLMPNTKTVKLSESSRSGGYFIGNVKSGELAAAKGHPDFLGILAHEFSHLVQWSEGMDANEAYLKVWDWLDYNQEVPNIEKYLDICMEYELDCEKRAVKLIRKWDLPVDIGRYIQKANAYMYFWKYMKYSRMFCRPGVSLYQDVILNQMPTTFRRKYVLTNKLFDIYVKAGI